MMDIRPRLSEAVGASGFRREPSELKTLDDLFNSASHSQYFAPERLLFF